MISDEKRLLDEKYSGIATNEYAADKERLAEGEPLAYVIGNQPFLGLTVFLDSRPLIPRPETEWWTEQLLAKITSIYGSDFGSTFLDLCAGSGAIGCAALARLPDARVYFGEVDPAHEATIQKNIRENHLDASRASVGIGDLFQPFGDMTFDVIASNPPYVPADRTLPASVAEYEPPRALFAGDDGLEYIRRIAAELPRRLAPGGIAWIECDCGHAEPARALFAAQGLRAEVMNDQYGKPRVIVCKHTRACSAQ